MSDKPREWWINHRKHQRTYAHTSLKAAQMAKSFPGVEIIHVIERSAYDALAERLRLVEHQRDVHERRANKYLDKFVAERERADALMHEMRMQVTAVKERDAARAEVERLKADLRNTAGYELGRRAVEVTENALHAAQAERDRYRQALERIIEVSSGKGYSAHQAFIAQEALEGKNA